MSRNQKIVLFPALALLAWVVFAAQKKGSAEAAKPWVVPAVEAGKENPVAGSDQGRSTAQAIFSKTCATCHGPEGKGDGGMARFLNPKPKDLGSQDVQSQSDGSLFYKLSIGRGRMVSYQESITEQNRWHLVRLIRSMANTPAPQTAAPEKTPAQAPEPQTPDDNQTQKK